MSTREKVVKVRPATAMAPARRRRTAPRRERYGEHETAGGRVVPAGESISRREAWQGVVAPS